MDSGYYAACTALISRTQELDTIANNLANVSTNGYRAEQDVFSEVLATASNNSGSALDQAMNSYGIVSGTTLDQNQGALQKTGNDLDVAIEGGGYFEVQTADGPMYTRNGAFQISAHNQLITAQGDAVMGDGGAITLPSGPISISPDGTISSNGALVGKLKVVDFPAGTQIDSVGNAYYSAPAGTATASTDSSIRQGMLESSNVNAITGMVQLVTAQRSAEMMQRALSMFNSEIDKTATQDLPKVG
ncbi:MAG TPA: flagellar basal-body rod protein FlgF [Acidobacteriaceae bacterium]|jgi:flagellar basal-body rod protein FlgF/flagellar basal-body rod protein FlgG|nr:flagellar basal-body rod protein FlgF [Acidobacteriaceae bacterium]